MTVKAKELAALDEGVKNENTRLKALETRDRCVIPDVLSLFV